MSRINRVLFPKSDASLDDYIARGGFQGFTEALGMTPLEIIERVGTSGLRGRGGAGFLTARKWHTVHGNSKSGSRASVIVNGAEGEPGTFKDRTILRSHPFTVLEGALIAARAVNANHIVLALKKSFSIEVARIRAALEEIQAAGYATDVEWLVFEGPDEYLYGEESAMLEAIDGRYPFPRIIPTYRVGINRQENTGWPPPALVNNTETIANIPRILAHGVDWFRRVGTVESPGSIIATVTGATRRHGVGEFRMGTPLREVLETVGGGVRGGSVKAVLSGVSNPVIPGSHLDVLVSYEALAAIDSGLGSASFIVCDETSDMVAVAAGISRFLSVESCGQCRPCKLDGIDLSDLLARLWRSEATQHDFDIIRERVTTVSEGARCYLGVQQNQVLTSIIEQFPEEFEAHVNRTAPPVEPVLIAELVDIQGEVAILDERHTQKQPDWTYEKRWSRSTPVDILSATTPPWSRDS